jgi:hypothetical protein
VTDLGMGSLEAYQRDIGDALPLSVNIVTAYLTRSTLQGPLPRVYLWCNKIGVIDNSHIIRLFSVHVSSLLYGVSQ